MKRVHNKICLVTGAARGLGLAAAEALLQEGARVMITDLDRAAGESEAARLTRRGFEVRFMVQDVSRP
jgi:NAD(P)-dependent dehydrogenase (short-subunit alcohol dehydrogenase family)